MRKFVPFVAVAALVAAAPVQAQNSCLIETTVVAETTCPVPTNFSMVMRSLMSLTLSGTSVTLNTPLAVGEFVDGLVEKTTVGPSFQVKSNRSYRVQISADAPTFSHTPQAGAATYAKPASDVQWRVGGSGNYSDLSTDPADIGSGIATALSAASQVGYNTKFNITKDQPGTYALGVTFTLVAP